MFVYEFGDTAFVAIPPDHAQAAGGLRAGTPAVS
jgi:hypothetical protein